MCVVQVLPVSVRSCDVVLDQSTLKHSTERTVREFVNEILLGIFFWWMNHYLNDLPRMIPRMTEDLCGSKRKKGDPV